MLDLGTTEFDLSVPSLPATELEALSDKLFDDWEQFLDGTLSLSDFSLSLQVEDGSIKGRAAIGAVLGVLYIGIGNYGDFVSGLNTIGGQLAGARNWFVDQAKTVFSCPNELAKQRKSGGSLGAIQKLFVRVQKGEITPEQATAQARSILGDEVIVESGFLEDLKQALHGCPAFPTQMAMVFDDNHDSEQHLPGSKDPAPRKRQPKFPGIPPGPQYRVEVWRESKKSKKKIRVTPI